MSTVELRGAKRPATLGDALAPAGRAATHGPPGVGGALENGALVAPEPPKFVAAGAWSFSSEGVVDEEAEEGEGAGSSQKGQKQEQPRFW